MALVLYPNFKHSFQDVFFLSIIFSIVLIIQTVLLFRYLKLSHKILNDTLKMLQTGHYSDTGSKSYGYRTIDELSADLNKTIDSFKEINNKYQSQLNYLELLIEKIDIGILSINEKGKIILKNSASKKILGLEKLISLNDIDQKHPVLAETIIQSKYNRHLLIDIDDKESTKQLSIKITPIDLLGKAQKLISIHNISDDLSKTETEAWNRLLKILNHEIFNSVTPLSSLSSTLSLIIKNENGEIKSTKELSNEDIADIAESLDVIHLRSNNLINFINGFKKLAKVPPPKIEKINVSDLLNRTALLFNEESHRKGIKIEIISDKKTTINADQSQIEQAIINLISNSIHALQNRPNGKIKLESIQKGESIHIEVWDNGKGVPKENIDRIFIPFYSTRENGSGIGLSLARYLIQLNNGKISINSIDNKETCFTLIFS